ncbi:Plasma membrane sulfite pump involved in sulfite metabolism [Coemansia sp. RSA 986]|nr:Plasma membrane sulfite pump involved in sulfite metabolism [Coemansia sp. RSA 986]
MDTEQGKESHSSSSSIWSRATDSWLLHIHQPLDIVRWFMPSWFTVSMGTGILATCIGRIPYDISAVRTIGAILFFANIGLMVIFSLLLMAQPCVNPSISTYMRVHPRRMLHYGAVPMALGTVVAGIGTYGFYDTSSVALYVGWAIWWVSVALASVTSMLVVYIAVSRQTGGVESVTGAWLLLVAPLAVCATAGASIAAYLPASQAFVTLFVGYALLGAGAPLTCCIVVLYVHRLAVYKMPPHNSILTSFIPLGPVGQIGVGAISLGRVAPLVLAQMGGVGEQGKLLTDLGGSLDAFMLNAGILVALLVWGSCVFWAAHAIFSVAYQRRTNKIPFNISWWALTFPVGVFATLTAEIADLLDLWFFQVCFLALVALLSLLWLFNIARTLVGVWTGSIFGISELQD